MSALTETRDHARAMAKNACASDARLWTQIADEIDAYLTLPDTSPDLFGHSTREPVAEVSDA